MCKYAPSSWGPGHLELAEKARKLGWHGGGSFWGLCQFAGVDTLDCAGPHREHGIKCALTKIAERLKKMEDDLVGVCTYAPATARCSTEKALHPCR